MPKIIKKEDNDKREYIISNILEIIGINKDNDSFYLNEMDLDIDKQNKIYELEDEIKKYYICSHWSCFSKPIKRKWLSIIKNICKEHDKTIISYRKKIKDEITDKQKDFTIYIIKL